MDKHLSAIEATEQLFELYGDEVYRYARFSIHNRQEAEDLTQEVFLKVLRSWHGFRHEASPKTWLWSILRRSIADAIRKKRKHKADVEYAEIDAAVENRDADYIDVETQLATLSTAYQQVLILRFIQGFSSKETSEILGWSEAKVRTTLHRAANALRKKLSVDGTSNVFDLDDWRQNHGGV